MYHVVLVNNPSTAVKVLDKTFNSQVTLNLCQHRKYQKLIIHARLVWISQLINRGSTWVFSLAQTVYELKAIFFVSSEFVDLIFSV